VNKQELEYNIFELTCKLGVLNRKLDELSKKPVINSGEALEELSKSIENELFNLALEDCSVRACCGDDEYWRKFSIGEDLYIGTSTFLYGCDSDNDQYYVLGHEFTVKKL
jgi:hypothetical protein